MPKCPINDDLQSVFLHIDYRRASAVRSIIHILQVTKISFARWQKLWPTKNFRKYNLFAPGTASMIGYPLKMDEVNELKTSIASPIDLQILMFAPIIFTKFLSPHYMHVWPRNWIKYQEAEATGIATFDWRCWNLCRVSLQNWICPNEKQSFKFGLEMRSNVSRADRTDLYHRLLQPKIFFAVSVRRITITILALISVICNRQKVFLILSD